MFATQTESKVEVAIIAMSDQTESSASHEKKRPATESCEEQDDKHDKRKRTAPNVPLVHIKAAGQSSGTSQPSAGCIVVMFIIIDKLPFESIWRRWEATFKDTAWSVRFLAHAKFPERVQSPWLRAHLLTRSYRPEWASIELVKAQVDLLCTAFEQNNKAEWFVFASESCIPLTTGVEYVHDVEQRGWHRSWLRIRPITSTVDHEKARNVILGFIQEENICKSDQWVALSRAHVTALMEGCPTNLLGCVRYFKKVRAADEFFFSTLLSAVGIIKVPAEAAQINQNEKETADTSNISDIHPYFHTYVEWTVYHPETFVSLTSSLYRKARSHGCLFARKFAGFAVNADLWEAIVVRKEEITDGAVSDGSI